MRRPQILATLLALASLACAPPCRHDLHCPSPQVCVDQRCSEPTRPLAPACVANGCSDGRSCIAERCVFAPACLELSGTWKLFVGDQQNAQRVSIAQRACAAAIASLDADAGVAITTQAAGSVDRPGGVAGLVLSLGNETLNCGGAYAGNETVALSCTGAHAAQSLALYALPRRGDRFAPKRCASDDDCSPATCERAPNGVRACAAAPP